MSECVCVWLFIPLPYSINCTIKHNKGMKEVPETSDFSYLIGFGLAKNETSSKVFGWFLHKHFHLAIKYFLSCFLWLIIFTFYPRHFSVQLCLGNMFSKWISLFQLTTPFLSFSVFTQPKFPFHIIIPSWSRRNPQTYIFMLYFFTSRLCTFCDSPTNRRTSAHLFCAFWLRVRRRKRDSDSVNVLWNERRE